MNTKERMCFYFIYKWLVVGLCLVPVSVSSLLLNFRIPYIVLFAYMFVLGILAVIFHKINFMKGHDIEYGYIEFLELFANMKNKRMPRFIYGDYLYVFSKYYRENARRIYLYEEYFIDNYNYMHLLITPKEQNFWISYNVLHRQGDFCDKCKKLKEAYYNKLYGNQINDLVMCNDNTTEQKEIKQWDKIKLYINSIVKFTFYLFYILLILFLLYKVILNSELKLNDSLVSLITSIFSIVILLYQNKR